MRNPASRAGLPLDDAAHGGAPVDSRPTTTAAKPTTTHATTTVPHATTAPTLPPTPPPLPSTPPTTSCDNVNSPIHLPAGTPCPNVNTPITGPGTPTTLPPTPPTTVDESQVKDTQVTPTTVYLAPPLTLVRVDRPSVTPVTSQPVTGGDSWRLAGLACLVLGLGVVAYNMRPRPQEA